MRPDHFGTVHPCQQQVGVFEHLALFISDQRQDCSTCCHENSSSMIRQTIECLQMETSITLA
ncbi:MAG: hypothetical protein P8X54_03030 [Desulfuromonadales bacterium]